MQNRILQKFHALYGGEAVLYRAPGRINLLGEHTDYNLGFVLPAAIDREIIFAVRPNESTLCRVFSLDMDQHDSFDLLEIKKSEMSWANYIRGVVNQFGKANYIISGFDLVFGGNIPLGAGLSSSAALECGLATALNDIFQLQIPMHSLALMAQQAEHDYAGVNCGIMDQFASIHGVESKVIRLDCRSMQFEYFPIDLKEHTLLLCNTGVSHSLASSEYNVRRSECEQGLHVLQSVYPGVKSLRDVSFRMLNSVADQMDPVVFKRCNYVIGENDRVQQAVLSLENNDLKAFGELMYQTHAGLRHAYQVSCQELDFLVDLTAVRTEVLGARMMGGGFGGCTLNLVETSHLNSLINFLSASYQQVFGRNLEVYPVKIVAGCSKIILNQKPTYVDI